MEALIDRLAGKPPCRCMVDPITGHQCDLEPNGRGGVQERPWVHRRRRLRSWLRPFLMRRVSVTNGYDHYDEQIGVILKSVRWMVGDGYSLDLHYWPRRVLSIGFMPASPEFCVWDGCGNKPNPGSQECEVHELPF